MLEGSHEIGQRVFDERPANCIADFHEGRDEKKSGGEGCSFECTIRDRYQVRSIKIIYTNDRGAFHSRLIEATFCSFNYDKTKFSPLIISPVPRVSPSLSLSFVLSPRPSEIN